MHILLVNSHGSDLALGGAEKYVWELASGLGRRGHAVSVLSAFPVQRDVLGGRTVALHASDWREHNRRRLENHLGDVIARPNRRLTNAVAASRPDLVHTHNLPGISTAIWEVCRRLDIPVVHTIHDYYLLCPRVTLQRRSGEPCCPHRTFCRLRTARLTRWMRGVHDVVVVSEHVRHRHEHLFVNGAFHLVRHPITPFGSGLAAPRIPPQTIGYLGALERVKGIEQLLAAAPALAQLGYTVQIAGGGRLQNVVAAAAARDDVRYAGTVHGMAKRRFIESTDLAVVPSTWEEPGAPPYSVAEWLAGGRPVLASSRGGLQEAIQRLSGVEGVEPEADKLVAAVRRLADGVTWRKLVASIPPPVAAAGAAWLDRHEAVYELARSCTHRARPDRR
jgi:glycogen synthase